ncbi:MAG: DUF2975 domain-containing protein [Clostridia bacterium]|nr:DUF2975 domain-containing protein [Clostridia bacterium]
MNQSIKKKINSIGEAGNVISIILIVLQILGILALIAGLVIFLVMPKDAVTLGIQIDADATIGKSLIGAYMDQIDTSDFDGDDIASGKVTASLEKTEDGLVAGFSTDRFTVPVSRFVYGLFAGLVKFIATLIVLIILNRLSREFKKCDTPFSEGVIHWMTVFAWVMLGASVLSELASAVASSMMFKGGNFHFNLDLKTVLITLLVLFLTMIFRYGAKLQHEADETL